MELGVPLEGDGFFVCRTGLVVKDLEVNQKTPGCQACHSGIVGGNAMAVALGLECLLEDEIAIGVEESTSVIRVQLAEGVHHDEDLIGWYIRRTWGSGRQCWR